MSRFIRFAIHAAGVAAFPVVATVVGLRSLAERDHPAVLPGLDVRSVAAVPRPAIDPAKPTVVVLFGADLTEITDALGPYEMFARAGRYNVVAAAASRQPTLLTGGLRLLPHYSLAEIDSALGHAPDVVVIPNLPNADAPLNRPVIDWIRQQAAGGALIHSWCKGAMALAETGLLDGQTATAHWGDIATLEKRYPKVTWVRGVRWIDRGQYVMSAGITSGIDASLRVLIRIAGDSVARRVARELRYPNYHFALDPRVEQYAVRPADLILPANAAFRFQRLLVGVGLYDGVGEIDLSNIYDAHGHTMAARIESVAQREGPVVTEHGLTIYPSLTLSSGRDETTMRARALSRLVIPGVDAQIRAGSLVATLSAVAPRMALSYVHAVDPDRFGLEPVIEDLARTADVPTARFALKRMEYRSARVRFEGAIVPWDLLWAALTLAVAGLAMARLALKTLSESDRKSSDTPLTRGAPPVLQCLRRVRRAAHAELTHRSTHVPRDDTMPKLNRIFATAAAIALVALVIACGDAPVSPVPQDPTDPTDPVSPVVASITLDATELSIEEGASGQLVATPRDAQGAAISGIAVTWTSSDATIASVGPHGAVSGIRVGTATVTASAHGKTAQATATVRADYAFDLLYTVRTYDVFHEAFQLDLRQPASSATRLFPSQQWASQVRPSPDGSRIAYVAPNPIIGDASIFVADRDGSDSRMIVAYIGEEFREPVWSPDGTKLAYVRTWNDGAGDRSQIWTVNADGSNPVALTAQMSGSQSMPAWSPRLPDGSERIAFVQNVNTQPRIWTIRPGGADLRQLGSVGAAYDIQPAWSPDGSTIAFQRTTAGALADIWLMGADGSNERALITGAQLAGSQMSPTWSPDGRLIAFTSNHESTGGSGSYQVYTLWTDGSRLARRTFDAADKLAPVWITKPR